MRLDRFNLNLLVVLDALLEERSVTKASARLNLGQSATSGALAQLREHFDDALLVQVGRRLTRTPLAESLMDPVRDILLMTRATMVRKPNFDPASAQRRFMVCASDYVTIVMLSTALVRVTQEAPSIAVDIRGQTPNTFDVFDRGGIDLLALPAQYLPRLKQSHAKWFDDEQVCMVCRTNRQVGKRLSFDQYMALGHVAVRLGDDRAITFEEWFLPRYGKQRRVEGSVDNFGTLPMLVLGTERIVTLHRRLAEHFAERYPVRLVKAPFDMPPLQEHLCWPRHLDHDPAHVWFRNTLLAAAGAEI